MKRTIDLLGVIFFITLLSLSDAYCQTAPDITWAKCFGGSSVDLGEAIKQTYDGGYISVGFSISNDSMVTVNYGSFDVWVTKLDPLGALVWEKSYGGSSSDEGFSIIQTSDSGYVVVGRTSSDDFDVSFNHGQEDVWVIKLDEMGNLIWEQTYGGSLKETAYWIESTSDGGYILACQAESWDGDVTGMHGDGDCWILKLDPLGAIQWQKALGGTLPESAKCIIETNDGNFVFTGYTRSDDGDVSSNHGGNDVWVVKMDTIGNIIWENTYGGTWEDHGSEIEEDQNGDLIVVGRSKSSNGDVSFNQGAEDCWLFKISSSGGLIWEKGFGGSAKDFGLSIAITTDGNIVMAGTTKSSDGDIVFSPYSFYNYLVVQFDPNGVEQWQKLMGGNSDEQVYDVRTTTDGGLIVVGFSRSIDGDVSFNNGYNDVWVVKLGGLSTGLPEETAGPLNTWVDYSYQQLLLKDLSVGESIFLMDAMGRIIYNGVASQAYHGIPTGTLATGLYVVSAYSKQGLRTQKVVIQ